jgi:hypothetical protein
MWHSSYEQNNYGELFYTLVRLYKPQKIVELGTRAGYSAYHMAQGLKENGHGSLDCFDLWEENYGAGSISRSVAQENLKEFKDVVKLTLKDAAGVHEAYENIDILHIDLDNDGELLEKILPPWIAKTRQLVIIEGGSIERDQLAAKTESRKIPLKTWLSDLGDKELAELNDQPDKFVVVGGKAQYKEKPIAPWLAEFSRMRGDIEYLTIEPFPSVTLLKKKQ